MSAGVYYRSEDYVGLWRRLLIEVIDTLVVLVVAGSITAAAALMLEVDRVAPISLVTAAVVAYTYLVLLKRTPVRTLGYRVTRTRIVNLQGNVPGIAALTLRLLFAVFGPLNLMLDLLWIPGDECRQALRDKFANTYVIRMDAQPLGQGRIRYKHYHVLGGAYIFQEVARPEVSAGSPGVNGTTVNPGGP